MTMKMALTGLGSAVVAGALIVLVWRAIPAGFPLVAAPLTMLAAGIVLLLRGRGTARAVGVGVIIGTCAIVGIALFVLLAYAAGSG